MIEARLDKVVYGDPTTREQMIRELAAYPDEILPEVIKIIRSGSQPHRKVAAQVIQVIGYPKNARAIPLLLNIVADANALGRNEAIEAISTMEPEIIVPYLIHILWDRGRNNGDWVDDMAGICMMLKRVNRNYALGCGPVIAYLLSQEINLEDYDPIYVLRVLEIIGTDGASYALPSLIDFAGKETIEQDMRDLALQIIVSFPQELLEPYAQIFPPLQAVHGK